MSVWSLVMVCVLKIENRVSPEKSAPLSLFFVWNGRSNRFTLLLIEVYYNINRHLKPSTSH